ncbi:MAG: nitroreductase family protein [Endomicrobia bacterium]|nr:nitroreductase family protein [Endomicrobiia bacterium]
MDGLVMLKTRRSIRKYVADPIPDDIINEIVDCGRLAPSANNKQPWLFVVVKNNKLKNTIAEITDYGKFIKDAYCCIAIFCEETKYYLEDGCAATENILLAAWYFGIGSCWIAGDKKKYAEEVKKILDVPDSYKLVSIVALGYPEKTEIEKTKNINKKKLSEIMIVK